MWGGVVGGILGSFVRPFLLAKVAYLRLILDTRGFVLFLKMGKEVCGL